MAIPFHLPTDEETEDIYRRIDQIIFDLYEILRQLLRRQTAQGNDLRVRALTDEVANPIERPDENDSATGPLPDLVLAPTRKPPVPPPRRRRRRHHNSDKTVVTGNNTMLPSTSLQGRQSNNNNNNNNHNSRPPRSWLNVGFELRQIAEEFTIKTKSGDGVEKKRRHEIKASSLFSLLVPAPIAGSIWTTVIILVGWRMLVARQR
uniref:Uncharacterized protein n=1 Tax=Triatoma infestans TaxID=30076 RepID=A0A023EWP0_TRIIF